MIMTRDLISLVSDDDDDYDEGDHANDDDYIDYDGVDDDVNGYENGDTNGNGDGDSINQSKESINQCQPINQGKVITSLE